MTNYPWVTAMLRRPLRVAILVVIVVNAAYAAWALSSPMRAEWMYYVELDVPPVIASENKADNVAGRLRLAGYEVTVDTVYDLTILNATMRSTPDVRGQINGLGRLSWGVMWVELQCRVAYLRSDCPDQPESLLRSQLDRFAADSGLLLDTSSASFGDWDFATNPEFFRLVFQWFLLVASGIFIAIVAVGEHVRELAKANVRGRR